MGVCGGSTACFTSFRGGNMVDGLPPASSCRRCGIWLLCALRPAAVEINYGFRRSLSCVELRILVSRLMFRLSIGVFWFLTIAMSVYVFSRLFCDCLNCLERRPICKCAKLL